MQRSMHTFHPQIFPLSSNNDFFVDKIHWSRVNRLFPGRRTNARTRTNFSSNVAHNSSRHNRSTDFKFQMNWFQTISFGFIPDTLSAPVRTHSRMAIYPSFICGCVRCVCRQAIPFDSWFFCFCLWCFRVVVWCDWYADWMCVSDWLWV